MTHPTLCTLALAALALGLAAGPPRAQEAVGVTAAANSRADVERGTARRTVEVGADVVFRDRIETGETGLVQVLFVDGSAFTVGAASQVVIDEFVYNPATGAGAVTSELTRGALRFVGGRVSKGNNPVQFRTPVGTLGVRGAIVDIDLSPGCLPDGRCPTMVAALVFGNELTLTLPGGGTSRIWQNGQALVVFGQGAAAQAEVVPLAAIDQRALRARLAGRPGQRGGALRGPSEGEVADSGLPAVNSGRSPDTIRARPRPEVVTTLSGTDDEAPGTGPVAQVIGRTVAEPADGDAVRDVVIDAGDPLLRGTLRGVFGTPARYTTANGAATIRAPWPLGIATSDAAGLPEITVNESVPGVPVSVVIGDVTLDVPADEGEMAVEPQESDLLGTVRGGTVLRGPGGFGFYFLDYETPDGDPVSLNLITGTPTPRSLFYPTPEVGAASGEPVVRTYALGTDYARLSQDIASDVPLLNPAVAQAFGNRFLANAAETPFYIIDRADRTPDAKTLYAALSIAGTGRNQRSMIVSDAGVVFANLAGSGADALGIGGSRRGSFRLEATGGPVFMRGGTGSVQIANESLFTAIAGREGEAFVYSSGLGDGGLARNLRPGEAEFIDVTLNDPLRAPASPQAYSSTMVPAFLTGVDPTTAFDRRDATVFGFAAGMVETAGRGASAFRSVTSDDVEIRLNAGAATVGGRIGVFNTTGSGAAGGYRFGFGFDVTGTHPAASSGRSAYLDWTRFAANSTGPSNGQGGDSTLLFRTEGAPIRHRPYDGDFGTGADPGTYVVSSGLVPQPRLFAAAGVTPCACEFMQWGWWGTQTEFVDPSLQGGRQRDIVHLGTWATADIPRTDQLPTSGTGTFSGHAIGNVSAVAGEGRAQYVAVGDMTMTFDFAARIGTLDISNFDSRSFSGTMAGLGGETDRNWFAGSLSGSGLEGSASGAFARGPEGPAQGVLGSFDVGGGGYTATGTFMGER